MLALLPGALLLIAALLLRRYAPPGTGSWYGYRTVRSMRDSDTWREANTFCATLMLWGSVLVLNTGLTCFVMVADPRESMLIVSIVAAVVLVAIPIATEQRLKALFDDHTDSKGR